MMTIGAILFVLHALVAMIDGAYFHLYKYKLHTRSESVTEHFTHSLRAAAMTASAYVFFVVNCGGWLLWGGLAIMLADLGIETWDVLIERTSRAGLGGLSSLEYLSHAHAILLYAGSYAFVLASKPAAAFSLGSSVRLVPHPTWIVVVGWAICIGAGLSTVQHFLYLHPSYRRSTAA